MNAKKLIGSLVKIMVAAVVMVYLGLHTVNFFLYTFPPEKWYYSWLGFGLTGGGLIGYLIVFLWDADTPLKKVVALIMTVVCGIGEVLAAGFGMQIETWAKSGFTLTESDFNLMLLAVQVLAFAHFLALVVYVAGDKIKEMFGDADGDGVPNIIDPDYKKSSSRQTTPKAAAYASETEQVQLVGQGRFSPDEFTLTAQQAAALEKLTKGNGATDPTSRQR
jgi:hypothetical protein